MPCTMCRLVAFGLLIALHGAMAPTTAAEDKNIRVDGSTTVGPIAKALAEHYTRQNPEVNITISESGSGNGAKRLMNGECDVADMSRFMKTGEMKAAVNNGIMPVAHVVAVDGIAITVHPANPVQKLTLDQVRDIYAGKITNWKQVNGPDVQIVKISRDTNSGTFETFNQLVMRDARISADTEKVGSNGQAHRRVSSTPAAIGYVGMGFVDRKVKPLPINGVEPNDRTIATGKYPIARPLFMFTNGYPPMGTHLHGFVTLYLTPKGEEIIRDLGFVPVTSYASVKGKEE
jgi:phosphate transport system substrate-binding protein